MTTIPRNLSEMWPAFAPMLGNHLWQSTLFAIAAGLLTLMLRRNQAAVRYSLWLAASVKFLVPFSLLTAIGSHLGWSHGLPGSSRLYLVVEEVVISPASSSDLFQRLTHLLPAALVALWLGGFVIMLSVWCTHWRRVSAIVRQAVPLSEGREVEALRRAERIVGIPKPIKLLASHTSLEPAIFGIMRPVLLWPAGISARLDDAHLRAIVAHEVWHVRRRDNLAAAVHAVVEALFWFHPLVWWLGGRLVEERERACDEEAVGLGSPPKVYAESILKVCEFCVQSPLACVAGVTGADLKKRMEAIMNQNGARKLDFGRKLLLSAAGLLAIAVPVIFGLTNATPGRAGSPGSALQSDRATPTRVSREEMQGLIVKKVQPQYPEEARKDHIQGIVLLNATISKEGNVENLQLISGPPRLVAAATDAVKQWKYKPYLQNGEAIEVETQVSVNFTLAK
jgi:bla regulator protein blaR1